MKSQVDASTVSAGAFFSERRLQVPDYQRRYSWLPEVQIAEFWRDLTDAIGRGEYFLGLVILADGPRQEVVDGQQRLVTLTILANALRLNATKLGRRLVAESLRTDFLYSMDFETEEQLARIELTDRADREALSSLLRAQVLEDIPADQQTAIYDAHRVLVNELEKDLSSHENPKLRIGQWTEFLTKKLTFAVFMHPDRGAAFRVFEVINTRGKNLTPTELIKSYLIGSSESKDRDATHSRWNAIEEQLDSLGALDQLTTFVRHVVTLERGYVIPRELYQVVTKNYKGSEGVAHLLDLLELHLGTYTQLLDPSADVESSEIRTRVFALANTLSMTRFRPILLAASQADSSEADRLLSEIIDVLVPGALIGALGTGAAEAQFARAARRVHQEGDWAGELAKLEELRPSREEFALRLTRNISKAQAHVVRAVYLQGERIPDLNGYPHQVRPRNGSSWLCFDARTYADVGGYLGNWVLTTTERRPQGTHTPDAVKERLIPVLRAGEALSATDVDDWTDARVRDLTRHVVENVAGLWYGHR